MTDLDTLRQALRAPGAGPDPLDVPSIIERGRRLRRRRRLAAVAGGVCAAAAVFWAVTGAAHLMQPSAVPARPAAPAGSAPAPSPSRVTARPSASPKAPMATPSPSPSAAGPTATRSPSEPNPSASLPRASLPSPGYNGRTPSASPTFRG